mmetsp:Transcript_19793/g.32836  ORF Transcript_19793/g.32836 Transcript_19793/m.32836 type:complete len:224 (-) Transcript_19793:31-702(-)
MTQYILGFFYLEIPCLILLLSVQDRNTLSSNLGLLLGNTHGGECLESLHIGSDWFHNNLVSSLDNWLNTSGLLGRSIRRRRFLGPNDQILLVFFQSSHIERKRLLTSVRSTLVNSNTDSLGIHWVKLGTLEFRHGETASETNLGRIFLGLAVNNGAKFLDWTRCHGSSTGSSSHAACLLGSGLVEVESDLQRTARRLAVLLVEMKVGDDIIMLDHGCELYETS